MSVERSGRRPWYYPRMTAWPTPPLTPSVVVAPKPRSKTPLVLGGCGLLLVVSCCGFVGIATYAGRKQQGEFAPLAAACDGRPVGGAPALSGAPRLVVMLHDSRGQWQYRGSLGPPSYAVSERAQASAVVCLEEEAEVEDEECSFMTVTEIRRFRRTHYAARARLVEAATGRVLHDGEVRSEPPACVSGVFVPDDDDAYEGESIDRDDLGAWVAAWLATSTPGPSSVPGLGSAEPSTLFGPQYPRPEASNRNSDRTSGRGY
ncbi:MAG: hypothetical protein K8H88_13590 [Sandaracinaceae bacterium]|nr:hypothetical protein [Sandaracinaceae bacterium]